MIDSVSRIDIARQHQIIKIESGIMIQDVFCHCIECSEYLHRNFKCTDPSVFKASDIYDSLNGYLNHWKTGAILSYTYSEMGENLWDVIDLTGFHIDVDKIDRLYYLRGGSRGSLRITKNGQIFRSCVCICRMGFLGKPVYVFLQCTFPDKCICNDNNRYKCRCDGGGTVFISENAGLFMKLAFGRVAAEWDRKRIHESLIRDNVNLEDEAEIDYHFDILRKLSMEMMRKSEEKRKYRHRKMETKEYYLLSHDIENVH